MILFFRVVKKDHYFLNKHFLNYAVVLNLIKHKKSKKWMLCSMPNVSLVIRCYYCHFEGGLLSSGVAIVISKAAFGRLIFNNTPCWVMCSMPSVTLVIGCDYCHFEGGLRPP